MNRYIVGLNENGLGKTILAGKTEKLIETELTLEGRTKWTVQSMPNLDGIKTIAEQVAINDAQELADKEALKIRYQQEADRLVNLKYGDVIVKIFTIVDPASYPKTAQANVFVMAVNAHALEICNAIDASEPYEFDLSQFSCDITAQDIQTEIQGA